MSKFSEKNFFHKFSQILLIYLDFQKNFAIFSVLRFLDKMRKKIPHPLPPKISSQNQDFRRDPYWRRMLNFHSFLSEVAR